MSVAVSLGASPLEAAGNTVYLPEVRYCSQCGSAELVLQIPEGDNRARHQCQRCHTVFYENPKMVVGCIVESPQGVLLCRRAIEPRHGFWTVPGGFLELDESAAEGALRETYEEAQARVRLLRPFAHFDIPHIGQAYILFLAELGASAFGPGEESLETRLFPLDALPWEDLAFSVVRFALACYVEDAREGVARHHHAVVHRAAGHPPYTPEAYSLRDHMKTVLAPPS